MKILNIFKKETKDSTKSNIQRLEKNQLRNLIGGTDTAETTTPVTQEKKGINAMNVKLG